MRCPRPCLAFLLPTPACPCPCRVELSCGFLGGPPSQLALLLTCFLLQPMQIQLFRTLLTWQTCTYTGTSNHGGCAHLKEHAMITTTRISSRRRCCSPMTTQPTHHTCTPNKPPLLPSALVATTATTASSWRCRRKNCGSTFRSLWRNSSRSPSTSW